MPNWVNSYATVTGDRKKVEEFMTFFLDSTKDNKDREEGTYFYRSFLQDSLETVFSGIAESGEVTVYFYFDIAWEMNNTLALKHKYAKVQDVAKRLKLDVEIEGVADTNMFKQKLVYKAYTYDKPQLELTDITPTECTCNKCGEKDYLYQSDQTHKCWNCRDGEFE